MPMKYFLRALLICLLAVPFVWFGLRYGQAPQPAYGEIFRELSRPLLFRHQHAPVGDTSAGWRISRINTNLIPYRVDKNDNTIPTLFDALEQAALPSFSSLPGAPQPVTEKPGTQPVVVPAFRFEWEDWGVLGLAYANVQPQPLNDESKLPAASDLTAQAALSSSGGLLTTVAFFNRDEGVTTTLTFWLDNSVDIRTLLPTENQDAPGRDATDVPRYPGLKRSYTVEEMGDSSNSIVALYAGPGSAHTIANFYRERMAGLGWEGRDLSDKDHRGNRQAEALVFLQKGKECLIAVEPAGTSGRVQVVVALREALGGG